MDLPDAIQLPRCQIKLTCVVCGESGELQENLDDALMRQIQHQTGFSAEIVQVDASGTCRRCRQSQN